MALSSFSCQVSIKLHAGDKVELKMLFGKVIILYVTGWMLEEDLPIQTINCKMHILRNVTRYQYISETLLYQKSMKINRRIISLLYAQY